MQAGELCHQDLQPDFAQVIPEEVADQGRRGMLIPRLPHFFAQKQSGRKKDKGHSNEDQDECQG